MTIKLYEGRISWNARKVRLLAAELGIPLERVAMDFQRGDYRTPEYLAKNPNGKIPTIDDDGFVLWESNAILKYLAAKKPERGLLPSDPKEMARVDQWLFWWTAHVESALDLLLFEKMIKPFLGKPGNDPAIVAHADSQLGRFLPILDAQLAGKEWVLGKLSLVDFACVSHLDVAPGLGVELAAHANIVRWQQGWKKKPYFTEA